MNYKVIVLVFVCFSLLSCKKEPGEGGFASIEGKVLLKDYDATYTILQAEYYAAGETVYIIYGSGNEIGNTVKTSYDGSFKFNYLNKGNYKIYVLGEDPTKPYLSIPKEKLVEVAIGEKKQKVVLDDLVIIK
jgi:phage-related tail fiber protein